MIVREVTYGSPDYDRTVELRREVLRRPLGLDLTKDQLAAETSDIHLAMFEEERAVACLVLTPKAATILKMRQVAVQIDRQGRGLGRRLVEESESWGRKNGYRTIVLNARESAVPFYATLGYAAEGEPFEEVGLPHRAMTKSV